MRDHENLKNKIYQLKDANAAIINLRRKSLELRERWHNNERELEVKSKELARLKAELVGEIERLSLNRREPIPKDIDGFITSVEDWVERARLIRQDEKVVYLDGSDLDIPDVDIPWDEEEPRACYPCNVYRALEMVLSEMPAELRDVIRCRYGLHRDEKHCHPPGFIAYQWYIAQQLNTSRSTVGRRLKRAERYLRHPYRSKPLWAAMDNRGNRSLECSAEYLIYTVTGWRGDITD